jgi:hypothetical protein
MSKERDKQNKMPPFPPGYTSKYTGPAYRDGMGVGEARRLWQAFQRDTRCLRPTPRQTLDKGVR